MKKIYPVSKRRRRGDYWLAITALLLSGVGILIIFEASAVSALRDLSDQYYYVKGQAVWLGVGILGMLFAFRFDYRRYYNISVFALLGVLALLILVFIPGVGIKVGGSYRWLNLGFFRLQPTELAKLALVIYLSAWFTYQEKERLLPFLILLGMVLGLIVLEPDLGTAVIIGTIAVALYFLSGAPIWHFVMLIPVGVAGIFGLSVTSPYRYRRLTTFLDSGTDPLGASYHVRQLLLSLGSGGFLGTGIGKSRQKFSYLPEATTDSIFAIVGEELGFLGASLILFLYFFLIIRGFKIAGSAPTRFGQLLASGITAWFAIQTLVNLGAVVSLLPLTGVPLPFLSYGGSSLIVSFYAVGILLNISRQS